MTVMDEQVSFSLEINVDPAYQDLRRIQTVAYRTIDLLARSGLLPEEREKTLRTLQRAIALANQARLTFIAMQAAAGPWGWALAGTSLLASIFTVADLAVDLE